MRAYERLLRYVKVATASDPTTGTHPSTAGQFTLANLLADELRAMGADSVRVDEHCYVYAKIPACAGYEGAQTVGFIAHLDTSPDAKGEGVVPLLHENYDGGEVALGHGKVLSPADFPRLAKYAGRTLITASGDTLLGADDKGGIAEIMTLAEELLSPGCSLPHGAVAIAFTPDEEIGEGADFFDVAGFGADFAFTVDGDEEGSLEYENFNAAEAVFTVKGRSVHPGSAKGIMRNAAGIAAEIHSLLPENEVPEKTEGREGFYHLSELCGTVEEAKLSYIVRDHDAGLFAEKCENLRRIEKTVNEKHGAGTVSLSLREQYRNMREVIEPCKGLIELAKAAIRSTGLEPEIGAIRGGTDGARLSFMGLPCPDLGGGGGAFHGPYEFITAEGMDQTVSILRAIVDLTAKEAKKT